MPKESALQRSIIQYLRQRGAKVYNIAGHPYQQKATPDLLVCWKGHFVALEVKTEDGVASKLQVRELEEIDRAGGVSAVVRNKEQVTQLLEILPGLDRRSVKRGVRGLENGKAASAKGKDGAKPEKRSPASTEPKSREKSNVSNGQRNLQSSGSATRRVSRNKKAVSVESRHEQGRLLL